MTVSQKHRRDKRHVGRRHGDAEGRDEPLGWLAQQLRWERRLTELRDQASTGA
jgi:hypothetical protein